VAGIHKIPDKKKAVDDIIEITGLTSEQKKKIGALSKGFRQRVGLAQALIHNPEVLILDEPTSGLDPNQLIEIRNLIKATGKKKTIMLSTHIMQEVEAVCSRAIIIDKGKIVADDSTLNLSKNASGKQAVIVEFNQPVDKSRLLSIQGVTGVLARTANIYELQSDKKDVRELIFKFAVDNNLAVLSMQKSERGLEEIFQQLTAESRHK
jgi:ABC-2 type transport system ATP-binding protein